MKDEIKKPTEKVITLPFPLWQKLQRYRQEDGSTITVWLKRMIDFYSENSEIGKEIMAKDQKTEDMTLGKDVDALQHGHAGDEQDAG